MTFIEKLQVRYVSIKYRNFDSTLNNSVKKKKNKKGSNIFVVFL